MEEIIVKKAKQYWCKNRSDTYDVILMLTLEHLHICLSLLKIIYYLVKRIEQCQAATHLVT